MTVLDLIAELRRLSVQLRTEGDRLLLDAPKGAITEELAARIRAHKQELLAFLGGAKAATPVARPRVRRLDHPGPYPLSHSQRRVWFIEQLEPGTVLYNAPAAFLLHGPCDHAGFVQCIRTIVERHDVMRTGIEVHADEPVQVVHPSVEVHVPVLDRSLESDPLARTLEELDALVHESFDLAAPPLFDARLFVLSEAETVFFFMPHHIIWDGWSFDVFLSELKQLYEAHLSGSPCPLAPLRIQYADFCAWQEEWLESGELERQLGYWRERLAGELPVLSLPTDFPRPRIRESHGERVIRTADGVLAEQLTRLAREEGATLYMALLAAYEVLLYRYTGQDDLIVGAPMASHSASETEAMLGFFVNTLVLRTDLSGNPPFREALRRVRDTCLDAFSHPDVPFEKLVEELQPKRDRSRTTIHQTEFGLQEASRRPTHFGPLRLEQLIIGQKTVGTDLILWVLTRGDRLPLALDYSTQLFRRETIERMLNGLVRILETVVTAPDTRIAALPLQSEREQERCLALSFGETGDHADRCVHEWIAESCDRHASRVALEDGARVLTYDELRVQTRRTAAALRALGVGPDAIVGVGLRHSADLVVCMLAILECGAAYLPLDPDYPAARLAFMVEDSGAELVIVDDASGPAAGLGKARCIAAHDLLRATVQFDDEEMKERILSDRPAYVIYTSGSTGTPKGVVITHRNVVQFLAGMDRILDCDRPGRWLAITTVSFDISVLEIFGSLAWGFTVVLGGDVRASGGDSQLLAQALRDRAITHLQCTPSQARILSYDPNARSALASLQHLLVGGEELPLELARELRACAPRVTNMYGPTEATVWTTAWDVPEHTESIRIGRPLVNESTFVLDDARRIVPQGVIGELWIGGAGLARGYWRQPDLTAQRFLEVELPGHGLLRLYRTGDLARFDADGLLEFVGRADTQVKIRGHRIELGEIENQMSGLPGVQSAAVRIFERSEGDRLLVGYVTTQDERIDVERMLQELRQRLPHIMVPSTIVRLPTLPLTANGKIDRSALPEPHSNATGLLPRVLAPLDRIPDPAQWLHVPVWRETLVSPLEEEGGPYLLFLDASGIGAELAGRLRAEGEQVVTVESRDVFRALGPDRFALNPELGATGYRELASALSACGVEPRHIVHLWLVTQGEPCRPGSNAWHRNLEHGVESLTHLLSAWDGACRRPTRFTVVTSHARVVRDEEESTHPEKALARGPCAVLPREAPGTLIHELDLELPHGPHDERPLPPRVRRELADVVARLCRGRASETELAYRGGRLLGRRLEARALSTAQDVGAQVQPKGHYLFVGAIDPATEALALVLTRQVECTISVLERHEADRDESTTETTPRTEPLRTQLRVRNALRVDLTDAAAVRASLARFEAEAGPILGVCIHVPDAAAKPAQHVGWTPGEPAYQSASELHALGEVFEERDLDWCFVVASCEHEIAPFAKAQSVALGAYAAAWTRQLGRAKRRGFWAIGPFRDLVETSSGEGLRAKQDPLSAEWACQARLGLERSEAFVALERLLSGAKEPELVLSPLDPTQLRERASTLPARAFTEFDAPQPRDDLERALVRVWSATLGLPAIGLRDDFFEIGGHSILAAKLFSALRTEFGVEWPLSMLFEGPTIEQCAAFLRHELGLPPLDAAELSRPRSEFEFLVPMHDAAVAAGQPLFLFSGMFGNILNLRHLGRLVGRTRPVYAVQARGLVGDVPPHASFEDMATDYLAEMRRVAPEGPYFLAGFCSGGVVAFEIAHRLLESGEAVGGLFFLDSSIPEWPELSRLDRWRIHGQLVKREGAAYLFRWARERIAWQVRLVRERFGGTRRESDAEYANARMREAFLRQMAAYRTRPLALGATLFRPPIERRFELSRGRWADRRKVQVLEDNGWRPFVEQLEILVVDGNHDSIVLEPHVRHLARLLMDRLGPADGAAGQSEQ